MINGTVLENELLSRWESTNVVAAKRRRLVAGERTVASRRQREDGRVALRITPDFWRPGSLPEMPDRRSTLPGLRFGANACAEATYTHQSARLDMSALQRRVRNEDDQHSPRRGQRQPDAATPVVSCAL